MKSCRRCGESKALEAFPRDRGRADGRFPYCKACHAARERERWRDPRVKERNRVRHRAWREANPEEYRAAVRASALRYRYGITVEEYEQLLALQGGGCAVCDSPVADGRGTHRLHVDHDHATGEVRGLLCFQHNVLVEELVKQGLELGEAAITYLLAPPARKVLSSR